MLFHATLNVNMSGVVVGNMLKVVAETTLCCEVQVEQKITVYC